jgi:AcrR family transcriptional regulator
MNANAIGRPLKVSSKLSKSAIVKTAHALLNEVGSDALSFRKLAEKMNVSAMAVKYHVGSKEKLLKSVVDNAFLGVSDDPDGVSPDIRLKFLLERYCKVGMKNALLIKCVLAQPSLMPDELSKLTSLLRVETQMLNSGDPKDVMLNLLIDYTHGFIFSVAAAPENTALSIDDFLRSINWLISRCR